MTLETWQFLLSCFLVAWVVGFTMGSKLRLFKQAVEAI